MLAFAHDIRLRQLGLLAATKALHFCKQTKYALIHLNFFILLCSAEMLIAYTFSLKYSYLAYSSEA